ASRSNHTELQVARRTVALARRADSAGVRRHVGVRCGLVTDVALVEDPPAGCHVASRREHRWVRGDWQLLACLCPPVPGPGGRRRPTPLPLHERGKVSDTPRRSLVPPSLVVLLALGWTVLPGSPWFWTVLALSIPAWPLWLAAGCLFAPVTN